jgi:predicted double-glycine peptidase
MQVLKDKGFESASYSISDLNKLRDDQFNIVLISLKEKSAAAIVRKAGIKNVDELKDEGFIVHKSGKGQKTIYVLGYDEAGTM